MKDFFQLVKNLSKDFAGLKTIRVALLGDTSTQFLVKALRASAYDTGLDLQIWEAEYNQISLQLTDCNSDVYASKPEIVILFQASHSLLVKYNMLPREKQNLLAVNEIALIESYYRTITEKLQAKVIFYNYSEIDDSVFGNYANKIESSFLFQLRKLNVELMSFAANRPDFYLCDLSTIQNQYGKTTFFQPSVYVNSEMVLSIDIIPAVAERTVSIINAINGKFKKCVILDLDNTLWGGVIGDDGIENIQLGHLGIGKAFTEFQYWIKKLKNRGIIVAICSKNTEAIAKEPFEKHPDMVLSLDDIAVFVANWENKADNIRYIQQRLNIGFDAMVFIDDNPFERNLVRENIPDICVPEMPEDPAEYLEYLYSLNLFETVSFSEEDIERTKQYQIESQRMAVQQLFTDENEFLRSLDMLSVVQAFNKFNTPRVAQLSQRSNQYNLRTVRYTPSEVEMLSQSKKHFTFSFTLEDKFGDNGMICVIVLEAETPEVLFIENWFMSCRVLKRGMEHFALNSIVHFAKDNGFTNIKGEYIPSPKNAMVMDHYKNLGFRKVDEYWELNLTEYTNKECFINEKLQ